MTFKDHLEQVQRLHALIKRKSTGTPENLALRLKISRATIFRRIDDLKALGAEIIYDKNRQSYIYIAPFELSL